MNDTTTITRQMTLCNKRGLHARAAARFAADRDDAGKWIRYLLIVIVAAAMLRFLVF